MCYSAEQLIISKQIVTETDADNDLENKNGNKRAKEYKILLKMPTTLRHMNHFGKHSWYWSFKQKHFHPVSISPHPMLTYLFYWKFCLYFMNILGA